MDRLSDPQTLKEVAMGSATASLIVSFMIILRILNRFRLEVQLRHRLHVIEDNENFRQILV